jgi:uncharacterized RDD family membrane protein YckC
MTPGGDPRDQQGSNAGVVSRSLADIVDAIVVALILVAGYLVFSAALFVIRPRTFSFPSPGPFAGLLIGAVVAIAYLSFGWVVTGRTPGKQLAGLRVVGERGQPLDLLTALLRATLYVVFPIGLLWSAFSSRNASAQDLLLRTSVVYDWRHHAIEPTPVGFTDATITPP